MMGEEYKDNFIEALQNTSIVDYTISHNSQNEDVHALFTILEDERCIN
jgi:hypothetical protein